jgi:hypothetical protein
MSHNFNAEAPARSTQNTSQPKQNNTTHRLQKQHKTTMTLLSFPTRLPTQQPTFKITLKRKLSHAIEKPSLCEQLVLFLLLARSTAESGILSSRTLQSCHKKSKTGSSLWETTNMDPFDESSCAIS